MFYCGDAKIIKKTQFNLVFQNYMIVFQIKIFLSVCLTSKDLLKKHSFQRGNIIIIFLRLFSRELFSGDIFSSIDTKLY